MPQNPETPDQDLAAVTGSSRRVQDGPPVLVFRSASGRTEVARRPNGMFSVSVLYGADFLDADDARRFAGAVAAGSDRAQAVHDQLAAAKPGEVFDFEQRPGERVLVVVARSYAVEQPTNTEERPEWLGTPEQIEARRTRPARPDTYESLASWPHRHTTTEPTNTTERPEDAVRRFALELVRLAEGLGDRGIVLRAGPVHGAPVDTALAELDTLRSCVDVLTARLPEPAVFRSYPQDRTRDGVPEVEQSPDRRSSNCRHSLSTYMPEVEQTATPSHGPGAPRHGYDGTCGEDCDNRTCPRGLPHDPCTADCNGAQA